MGVSFFFFSTLLYMNLVVGLNYAAFLSYVD